MSSRARSRSAALARSSSSNMVELTSHKEELKLNRKLQNHVFQSWRLGSGALDSRSSIDLPAPVSTARSDAVDYLHTRTSVLRNHLIESQGRLFLFMGQQSNGALQIAEACCSTTGPEATCTLHRISALDLQGIVGAHQSIEADVDPSLAVVDTSALPITTSQADSTAAAAAVPLQGSMLVSSGRGDLTLLYKHSTAGQQAMQASTSVDPLRPVPPLVGRRPMIIEAAYATTSGEVRCIAWAVKSGGGAAAAPASGPQRPNASCETFVITLRVAVAAAQQHGTSSSSAAAAAAAVAAGGCEVPAEPRVTLAVVDVRLLRPSSLAPHLVMVNPAQDVVLLGLDPGCGSEEEVPKDDVMHIDCRRPAGAAAMDDDESDMDPRSLQEAAARLAKYTSDEPGAEPPSQQWADIYKESGPDGIGAMGGEPAVELVLLPAARGAHGGLPHCEWQLSCGASRVLSSEAGGRGLLGLSDDVDCAVLSLSWAPAAAAGREPRLVHESFVPALAYIAAGKEHKKHLLLGRPQSPISAVLIEAQKLYYVYRRTDSRQEYGSQDIVDMELSEGESVLGARLVELAPAAGALAQQPAVCLLLLTRCRLLLHHLRA